MTTPEQHYRALSPPLVARFMSDFDARPEDGFAVFGNGGHESLGFTQLQELQPTVKGSRGGTGLFQWTGPRRRAFEAYCRRSGKDPKNIWTHYAWLFDELKSTEKRALPELKSALGLRAKVVAFEEGYERAGVKAYDKRLAWARIVESAYRDAGRPLANPTPAAEAVEALTGEAKVSRAEADRNSKAAGSVGAGGGIAWGGGAIGAADGAGWQFTDWLLVGLGVALVAGCIWLALRATQAAKRATNLSAAAAAYSSNAEG